MAKEKGNLAFRSGDLSAAITHYTDGLADVSLSADHHLLFGNRSACYFKQAQFDQAAMDAAHAVRLRPDWVKGYQRMGAALLKLDRLEEAQTCYEQGIQGCAGNAEDQTILVKLQQDVLHKLMVKGQQEAARKNGPVRGAWASSETLAQRLASKASHSTASQPAAKGNDHKQEEDEEKKALRLTELEGVDATCWYHYNANDGSMRPPVRAVLAGADKNTTVMINLAVTRAQCSELLVVQEQDTADRSWYLPTCQVSPDCDTIAAAARVLLQHELAFDTTAPLRLVGVENYPSLKDNFLRLTVHATLTDDLVSEKEMKEECYQGRKWVSYAELTAMENTQALDLTSMDFVALLESNPQFGKSLPLPSCALGIGFPCQVVRVCVEYENKVIMVRSDGEWALPTTHQDHSSGEDIGFTASRFIRGIFGLVAEVRGISRIECGPLATGSHMGFRTTVVCTVESVLPDPSFEPPENTGTATPLEWEWKEDDREDEDVIPLVQIDFFSSAKTLAPPPGPASIATC